MENDEWPKRKENGINWQWTSCKETRLSSCLSVVGNYTKDGQSSQVTCSFSILSETLSNVLEATSNARRSKHSTERERGKFTLDSKFVSCGIKEKCTIK